MTRRKTVTRAFHPHPTKKNDDVDDDVDDPWLISETRDWLPFLLLVHHSLL